MIEAVPRRTPFPRLSTPDTDRGSTRGTTRPSEGPSSSRLRQRPLPPTTERRRDETTLAPTPTQPPTSGARPIDRERILERYKRPERPGAAAEANPAPAGKTADDVRKARDAERARVADSPRGKRDDDAARADAVKKARDEDRRTRGESVPTSRDRDRAARANDVTTRRDRDRASAVKNARDLYRAEQDVKLERREIQKAAEKTRRLREEYAFDPQGKSTSWSQGSCVSKGSGYGLYLGFSVGMSWCNPYGWYATNHCWPWWYWNSWDYCNNYWYGWSYGSYPYSWCSHPFSWTHRFWFGTWPNYSYWWPNYYARYYYSPPVYYASAIAEQDDGPDVVIYDYGEANDIVVEGGDVEVRRVEGSRGVAADTQAPQTSGSQPIDPTVAGVLDRRMDTLARLATEYLADGDAAFRERRYGDAAHFYAKSIEFRPDEGVLYLVLSDALFATGDYHYGAFALRRALELDPALAEGDLDKHEFYTDPSEFDRQLATLERFVADHPTDVDARVLLAANYLFSRKSQATLDLLEATASETARKDPAGKLILEAARKAVTNKK